MAGPAFNPDVHTMMSESLVDPVAASTAALQRVGQQVDPENLATSRALNEEGYRFLFGIATPQLLLPGRNFYDIRGGAMRYEAFAAGTSYVWLEGKFSLEQGPNDAKTGIIFDDIELTRTRLSLVNSIAGPYAHKDKTDTLFTIVDNRGVVDPSGRVGSLTDVEFFASVLARMKHVYTPATAVVDPL